MRAFAGRLPAIPHAGAEARLLSRPFMPARLRPGLRDGAPLALNSILLNLPRGSF